MKKHKNSHLQLARRLEVGDYGRFVLNNKYLRHFVTEANRRENNSLRSAINR